MNPYREQPTLAALQGIQQRSAWQSKQNDRLHVEWDHGSGWVDISVDTSQAGKRETARVAATDLTELLQVLEVARQQATLHKGNDT